MELSVKLQAAIVSTVGSAMLLLGNVSWAGDSFTVNGFPARFISQKGLYYPPALMRLGVSGRVVLAYSVRISGHPEKIIVLVSDDSRLERPAKEYLDEMKFEVPKTWEADAGQWRRFHLEFSFTLDNDPPRPKLVEDGDVIVVTGRMIKGRK